MNKLVKIFFIASFFSALLWIILIPLWQYPDEQSHFAQVQDLAELGKVPVPGNKTSYEILFSEEVMGTKRDWQGNNNFTYHPEYKQNFSKTINGPDEVKITELPRESRTLMVLKEATLNPPLYYWLGSRIYKLFSNSTLFTRVYLVRFFSLSLFLATVFTAYRTSVLIFSKNKLLWIVMPALIAFSPMFIFASTGVLTDPMTNFLFSLIVFLSLKILIKGLNQLRLFFIFGTIVLGTFTRQQFLISVPIVVLALTYQAFKNWKKVSKYFIGVCGVVFLLFVLDFLTPFSFIKIPEAGNLNLGLIFQSEFLRYFSWTARHTYSEVLPWYFGVYRWLSLTVPHINYQVINRLIGLALIGVVLRFSQIFKRRKIEEIDLILIFMILVSLIYYLIFFIWDYFFYISHNFSFGIQGRYFFPMIIAHFTILTVGFWSLAEAIFKSFSRYVLIFIVFLMFMFNNISLGYVSASYYETSNISTFVQQASQYKPSFLKGNVILLVIFLSFASQIFFLLNLISYAKKTSQ